MLTFLFALLFGIASPVRHVDIHAVRCHHIQRHEHGIGGSAGDLGSRGVLRPTVGMHKPCEICKTFGHEPKERFDKSI